MKQETVSGWQWYHLSICKSAPCSRQITMPAPHHSVFYRLDAHPATQPTVSKHCDITAYHLKSDWAKQDTIKCINVDKTFLNHTPSVNRHVWNQADRTFHRLLTTVLQRLVAYMKTNMPGANSTVFSVAANQQQNKKNLKNWHHTVEKSTSQYTVLMSTSSTMDLALR